MDVVKEVFTGIKERLASPFFGAFLISWSLFNWDILICLVGFDLNMLNACGWSTYLECVSEQAGLCKSLIFPLGSTFLYVLGYPYLKGKIAVHQARVSTDYGNQELDERKITSVKLATIVKMQQELEEQEKILKNRIEKNEENFRKAASLQTEVQDLQDQLTDLNDKLVQKNSETENEISQRNRLNEQIESLNQQIEKLKSDVEERRNINIELTTKNHQLLEELRSDEERAKKTLELLQGEWVNNHTFPNGKTGKEVFFIKGNEYFSINNNQSVKLATIKNIHWEKSNDEELLVFTKSLEIPQMTNTVIKEHHRGKYLVNEVEVNYDEEGNMIVEMSGVEDGQIKIRYTRPDSARL